jgi:hypothetical protein
MLDLQDSKAATSAKPGELILIKNHKHGYYQDCHLRQTKDQKERLYRKNKTKKEKKRNIFRLCLFLNAKSTSKEI